MEASPRRRRRRQPPSSSASAPAPASAPASASVPSRRSRRKAPPSSSAPASASASVPSRRRRRKAPPFSSASASVSTPDPSTPSREAAVVQSSTKKTCCGSTSFLSVVSGPQGWADLPDGILQSIIALFPSFRDLLAICATCRPWSDAFSSYRFTFNFCALIPPLLLRPSSSHVYPLPPPERHRRVVSNCTWHLLDPTNNLIPFSCVVPLRTLNRMRFVGCSYGKLIFSRGKQCLLVDALTGTEVIPPRLPFTDNHTLRYGTLTAPPSSPESNLLVSTGFSLFKWQVGSEFWIEHPLGRGVDITQTVVFNGQVFAMGFRQRLFAIHLVPSLGVQELAVGWGEDMAKDLLKSWLVVCRDMLLMVGCSRRTRDGGKTIKAFRLDLSSKPATWVKVENLGDCSLFISPDLRSPTFSCTSPERWGGKSNCIYSASASGEPWDMIRFGETVTDLSDTDSPLCHIPYRYCWPESIWVFPSMFY